LELVPPSARTTRISLRGTTLEGAQLSAGDLAGKVVVINTWGSWCAPCNREAPELVAAHRALADRGVAFVGIDVREGPAAGRAFSRKFGMSYPSLAWDGGRILLQLQGKAPGTPTTLVVDSQGRLAARVLARVDAGTLESLVQDVLDE
jgi:thiol-disulfide isomerase/thioredoxin